MNLALWIAAGLLALVALTGGVNKTLVPKANLAKAPGGEWTGQAGVGFVNALGILELLAALGLLSTSLTTINGSPALALHLDGELDGVLAIRIDGDLISGLYYVRNPEKLTRVTTETALTLR
ncbi:DoxX family protein [Kitasatospora humi]|uniref:DoxX family protein n=1 Tax=Kitasatospora humi TaxID=2893891 RepID=UPI0024C043B1|nr:DoxX family protein [Kitasatospora humi]